MEFFTGPCMPKVFLIPWLTNTFMKVTGTSGIIIRTQTPRELLFHPNTPILTEKNVMKYVLIVFSWCINRYLIHQSIYIINRSHRLMKTSSIAVIAINIQSDSILRQTNKVHFLTEKILYRTTPELHQTMLKNFSFAQHPAPNFTKLH